MVKLPGTFGIKLVTFQSMGTRNENSFNVWVLHSKGFLCFIICNGVGKAFLGF